MTKYPYIGKFLNPLISNVNGLEGFHCWTFCIVETESALLSSCTIANL